MKIKYVIALVLVAVGLAFIISSYGKTSTYADFETCKSHKGKEYHVIGKLDRNKEIVYKPLENPNYFTFFLIDDKGEVNKVVYNNPKPQDFDKSEQIVLVGKMQDDVFFASQILLKCPSKYTNNEVETKQPGK